MKVSCLVVQGGVFLVKMRTSHPFCRLVGMMTVQASQPLPIHDPAERKMKAYQEAMQVNYLSPIFIFHISDFHIS